MIRRSFPIVSSAPWVAAAALGLLGCNGRVHSDGSASAATSIAVSPTGPAPDTPHEPTESQSTPALAGEPAPFRFVDVVAGSGVDFVHVSGMTPEKQFPTANGSGVAIFDFDNDGRLDLYFATGNAAPA